MAEAKKDDDSKAFAEAKELAKVGVSMPVAAALIATRKVMMKWVREHVEGMLRVNAVRPIKELKQEVSDLKNRIAVLERYITAGDEERSVGLVQSQQLERLATATAENTRVLKMPVIPVKDGNGRIIGAQRVERLDG